MSHISLNVPSGGLSRANSHRKPPKQRLTKLIKSSLKHTLKSTNNYDPLRCTTGGFQT